MPVKGGKVARVMTSLLRGYSFSSLCAFSVDDTNHVVEYFAVMIIITLLVLTQHHHVYTKVHVEERWR